MKPTDDTTAYLDELVDLQISLLESGKPLEAFDKFYRGVTPFLDFLSFESNSPVNIDKTF